VHWPIYETAPLLRVGSRALPQTCLSRARDTGSVVVDNTSRVMRNPATSNTSGTDKLDTREGTPVVEGREVGKSTWVPVGKEVREDTYESDMRPGAGTQPVASGNKQGKERVYKPNDV
jgi:hypothetical protein